MTDEQKHSHPVRDLLMYIAAGILVAALAIVLGIYEGKTGQQPEAILKWVGFAVMSFLVFFWTIRRNPRSWAITRFWAILGIVASTHLALGALVLLRVNVRSLFPFIVITPIEYFALSALLARLFSAKGRQDHSPE